ncbi:MAG: hypothetical protein QXK08_03620 [Candidatus Woesearchaeota archaeon]
MVEKQRKELIGFAQTARGLDDYNKLKLILFAAGTKPATFVQLKIEPKNIDDKEHFERHLKNCRIPFLVGRPKAFEEIVGIRGNAVKWRIKGSWYGYDLFKDNRHLDLFQKYLALVKRQKHSQADRISGKLYDYPKCCIEHYIKEHSLAFLRRNYSHYSYYKHLHDVERAFPLVMHTPCSPKCAASRRLNAKYAAAVRKSAPKFWKLFSGVKKMQAKVIVDAESELLQDVVYNIRSTAPVFPVKDGHEYSLITLKPLDSHYYILSHLTKKCIERGTVFPAEIRMRFTYADIRLGKPEKTIKGLHHERKFALP